MVKTLLSKLCAALLLFPMTLQAEEVSYGAVSVIESEGELIHLDSPAATMFVADPAIASLQVVSNKTVFILGHSEGKTTFYALDDEDEIMFERVVVVHRSLEHMMQTLRSGG